jgi:plasmid stabilization system protein ParE
MKVVLTRRAERNYRSIRNNILEKWGSKVAESFDEKTDELFELLVQFPKMGPVEKSDIRGFQLSSQTRIFYRIKGNVILILSLFEVRQDPRKRPR